MAKMFFHDSTNGEDHTLEVRRPIEKFYDWGSSVPRYYQSGPTEYLLDGEPITKAECDSIIEGERELNEMRKRGEL